jgi:hypothetical protein
MSDISGRYEFHRDSSSPGMQIVRVKARQDGSGEIDIVEGQIGPSPITGTFDPGNLGITLKDPRQPGDTLSGTNYTGYVMLNPDSTVYGMSGIWQQNIGPRTNPGVLSRASGHAAGETGGTAMASSAATGTIAHPLPGETVKGAWFAIRLDEPLV